MPPPNSTVAYLHALTGDEDPRMWWAALWSDKKERKPAGLVGFFKLSEINKKLQTLNRTGFGIYCVVNETDGKGQKDANILSLRAAFIDCDKGEPTKGKFLPGLMPSFCVQSHRGPHYYWLLDGLEDIESFSSAQKGLAKYFGSDPAVHNPARLMRVPGFVHPGTGKDVGFTKADTSHLFTISDLDDGYGPFIKPVRVKIDAAPSSVDIAVATSNADVILSSYPPASDGDRNNSVYRLACRLRDVGINEKTAALLIGERYGQKCIPPLEKDETEHAVKDAYLYAKGVFGSKANMPVFTRGDEVEAADWYIENLGEHAVFSDGKLWRYIEAEGVYRPISVSRVISSISNIAGSEIVSGKQSRPLKVSHAFASGVYKIVSQRLDDPDFFRCRAPGITTDDGCLELSPKGSIERFVCGPDRRSRARFPKPRRANPHGQWSMFLEAVLGGDKDSEQKISLINEFVGACAFGIATKYGKSLLLYGRGGSGKGTLLGAVSNMFPEDSVSSVHPGKLRDPVYAYSLVGKLMNIVDDIPSSKLERGGEFKSAVTGDELTAKHHYQMPFIFKPVAGHIFSCNQLPDSGDVTSGMWRRLIVVKFNRSFVEDGSQDVNMREKLSRADGEILAAAIEGATRLVKQGHYTVPESHQHYLEMMQDSSDPIRDWMRMEDLEVIPQHEWYEDDRMPSEKGMQVKRLYMMYRSWYETELQKSVDLRFGEFKNFLAGICCLDKDYGNSTLFAALKTPAVN